MGFFYHYQSLFLSFSKSKRMGELVKGQEGERGVLCRVMLEEWAITQHKDWMRVFKEGKVLENQNVLHKVSEDFKNVKPSIYNQLIGGTEPPG